MSNLTITVDEQVLRRARIRALQEGTSVNAVLRAYLEIFAGGEAATSTRQRLAQLARSSTARGDPKVRWTRDALHDRTESSRRGPR